MKRALRGIVALSGLLFMAVPAAADQRLIDAVKDGNRQMVRQLLRTKTVANEAEPDGTTPLVMAIINSRLNAPPSKWNSAWIFSLFVVIVLVTNFLSRIVMSHL